MNDSAQPPLEHPVDDGQQRRDGKILLRILPMSSSMAGFCIAGIGLFQLHIKSEGVQTFAGDVLAIDSAVFPFTTYMTFWALRTRNRRRQRILTKIIDASFIIALSMPVTIGFLTVYSIL